MICAITGSSGVLGTNFLKQFPNITFVKYKHDLAEKHKLKKWIKNNKFDYFLHFAAIVPVYEVNADYQHAKKINYDSVKIIVKELKKKKKKIWFFFSSTSHVYQFSKKKLKEHSIKEPINKYGKLKLMAEKYIIKNCSNTNIVYCIGRIFSFTHKTQNKKFFIPSVFLQKAKQINTLRDFIDIRDICSCIMLLMSKNKRGVFNIGSGIGVNLIKIISLIQNKKINIPVKPDNNLVADITKIKRLGWKKKYNIKDIIKEYKKKNL